jgi:hypothetical protein
VIRQVTTAINAALATYLAALSIQVPTFRFGRDELAIEDAPPRICWVPRRGNADGAIIQGADFPPMFGQPAGSTTRPATSPLWRRKVTVDAHVWAIRDNPDTDPDTSKDYDACETLANHLVAMMHTLTFGSMDMAGEDWDSAATQQGSAQRRGLVQVISPVLFIPWTREPDTLAVVDTMPITPEGT